MSQQREFVANALEATVRIGVLFLLAAWCFSIIQPFVITIMWGGDHRGGGVPRLSQAA